MRNVSEKKQNTHFRFNNFSSENCVVYEKKWNNMVQLDRQKYDNKIYIAYILPAG
jgi:hypothetical protein